MPLDAPLSAQLPRVAMRAEMLDAKTEHMLATAWRKRGDEAALHRLITRDCVTRLVPVIGLPLLKGPPAGRLSTL